MKVIVTFSGGKDSLAALLYVRNNISKKFITVFCDTGWESNVTYDYIKEIDKRLNLDLITLKSKKYNGFIDMVEKKGRFPSTKARFCTEELKAKPMIDFLLDKINDDMLVVQGIRAEESAYRSKMKKQCTYFKYYLEPYKFNKKGKPQYHTYRKKDVVKFRAKYADDVLRPIFEWTSRETVDYILKNNLKPNPLYFQGFKRVGCFPCIMCNHREVRELINRYPERINLIKEREKEFNSTLFTVGYIPDRYCTGSVIIDNVIKKFPKMEDVEKYIKDKNMTLDMFHDTKTSCMSFYGLCE